MEQLEHLKEDNDAEKVPATQDEHSEADADEYCPAAQLPVTADSPVVAQ